MKKRIYQRFFAALLVLCLVLTLHIHVSAASEQETAVGGAGGITEGSGSQNTDQPLMSENQGETEGQEVGRGAEHDGNLYETPESAEGNVPGQSGKTGDGGEASAADNMEDGISALAAGDQTVTAGESITIEGSGYYGYNHQWSVSDSSGEGVVSLSSQNTRNVVVTGVKPGTVTLTHTYSSYGQQRSEAFRITVVKAGTIEAKVYLRYSNAVPNTINANYESAEFGPSGNNVPYITVTVDLSKVMEKTTVWTDSRGYRYYSIESDGSDAYPDGGKDEAKKFWNEVIYPAIEETDREALDQIFGGAGKFIGYVLKAENDGWHIDGVLAEDPPVYVVELYDHTGTQSPCLFAISNNDETLPGVTYAEFKTNLERVLGGSNYTYVTEENDKIVVQYQKDGKLYETTVVPRRESGDEHSQGYHIYPNSNGGKFGYSEITKNIYYLCRLKIESTVEVTGALSLSKTVKGSAANPEEHFVFELESLGLTGAYQVSYTGTEEGGSIHGDTITFTDGKASLRLKNGETAKILGLPSGIQVTVKEESGSYEVTAKVNGKIVAYRDGVTVEIAENTSVDLTNALSAVPVTGFYMDSLPGAILILCVICAGVLYLLLTKCRGSRKA